MSPCVKVVSQARPSFLALQTYQQKQAASCCKFHKLPTLHTRVTTVTYCQTVGQTVVVLNDFAVNVSHRSARGVC